MRILHSSFIFISTINIVIASQFCAVNKNEDSVTPDPADYCNATTWENMQPPYANRSLNGVSQLTDCTVSFLLDISPDYVTEEEYEKGILIALYEMAAQCLSRGVGYDTFAYPLFHKNSSTKHDCCSDVVCMDTFTTEKAPYDLWVYEYEPPRAKVYDDSADANFTYVFLNELKTFSERACLYNTVVLITNRLFRSADSKIMDMDFPGVLDTSCITLTIILIGRNDITDKDLATLYHNMTTHLYVVEDIKCLYKLADCIAPCNSRGANACQVEELTECPYPTLPPTTPPLPRTKPSIEYDEEYLHIIYMFALSNKTKPAEFQNALYYIETPLQVCTDEKAKLVARFIGRDGIDSHWLTTMDQVKDFLAKLQYDEIAVPAVRTVDENEHYTMDILDRAVTVPIEGDLSQEGPRLILLTDFVSNELISNLQSSSQPDIKMLAKYDFEVYAFEQAVADEYSKKTFIKTTKLHIDDDFQKENGPKICEKKKSHAITVWIIIIGASGGLMLLLLVVTVIYRQKFMWMQKLNSFKNDMSGGEDDDIIDYWELSWDKLIVRSERLGNGAYGQVFKGKLIGSSPGLEHYYGQEATQYADCDVAVKMLPKHASERAHKEFMHEIDLMKSLGFNEHIVNMLGCITAVPSKSCLVLEYCMYRDLLTYVKMRKTALQETRSIDDQIDCTKEFLHFAWQIASGMKFLVSKNIIHRDLATRNVLIDEKKEAKIADFGLCVQASESEQVSVSCSGRLPIKWLAIECLQKHQFTFKSDVWSYGIVLFEMYSMGEEPFVEVEPSDMLNHLVDGNRPKRPLLASDKLWEVMNRCWESDPNLRPTFDELLTIFTILLEQATEGYGYLSLMKSSEHYRPIDSIEDLRENRNPEIEITCEKEEQGKENNNRRGSTGLVSNITNVFRRTAAGISRQFSAIDDESRANNKADKKKNEDTQSQSHLEVDSECTPKLSPKPRRKSNDFFSWTGLSPRRRKSFQDDDLPVTQPRLNMAELATDDTRSATNQVQISVDDAESESESSMTTVSLPSSPRATSMSSLNTIDV